MVARFSETRWTESVPVASRAIVIWNNIKKYVNVVQSRPKSKRPGNKSYQILFEAVKDKTMMAKFHFFVSIAGKLKPFLATFQSKPLIPFIYQSMKHELCKRASSEKKLRLLDELLRKKDQAAKLVENMKEDQIKKYF